MNNYTILLYAYSGMLSERRVVEASSFEEALHPFPRQRVTVIGEGKVKRFAHGKQVDSSKVVMVKSRTSARPIIFLNVGNLTEMYPFTSKAERDAVYKECFTTLGCVEFANNEELLKDITVCLDVMCASKSTLIEKKTSSGSVTHATWKAKVTPSSTENPFLKGNVVDMDGNTWKDIYEKLRSKPGSKILVRAFKKMKGAYPGWNEDMERKLHTNFYVSPYTINGDTTLWTDADGWIWSDDALHVLTPVHVKNEYKGTFDQISFVNYMVSDKTELAYPRNGLYQLVDMPYVYKKEWLQKVEVERDGQNVEVSGKENCLPVGRQEGTDNRQDARRNAGRRTRPVVDRSETPSIFAGMDTRRYDASRSVTITYKAIPLSNSTREGNEVRRLPSDSFPQDVDRASRKDGKFTLTERDLEHIAQILNRTEVKNNDLVMPMQTRISGQGSRRW